MNRQATTVFDIDTVEDYLTFCGEAVSELEITQDNVVRAFAAILALNHIPDWLQYKLNAAQRATLGLSGAQGEPVKSHFETLNSDVTLIREIANGFKHLKPVHSTQRVAGYGEGPYGIGPYGAPYLLIDLGTGAPNGERWAVGLDLCQQTLNWWRAQLSPLNSSTGDNTNV